MILLNGIVIGLAIAAPVGPIGVLVIRRTWSESWLAGFLSGLGAATADGLYGAVAAYGLTFISNFLVSEKLPLHIVGGMFLVYLGIKIFRAKPRQDGVAQKKTGLFTNYISTVFLTITNPMTIISFAAVFTGLGLVNSGSFLAATLMVAGVFLGSALWWIILSGGVKILSAKLDVVSLNVVNKISGIVIVAFGVFALASVL
jgi:threonine/homoserine/homoserine lactone efflux protein